METYDLILEETFLDYPSPEGNAVIVYMTGCNNNCEGCHSKDLQRARKYSKPFPEMIEDIIEYASRANTNRIVLLGGDPLFPGNLLFTKMILARLHEDFDICLFTGYPIEAVKAYHIEGAKFYKCGVFDKNQYQEPGKTDEKYTLASKNQNFYDENYVQISENGVLIFNQD